VLVNFGSFTFLCAIASRGWRKWKCGKMCGWVRWYFLFGVALSLRVADWLLITICMYCAGCGKQATNCKPITNLKEKTELSNLH